jgi:hypothetical protein
MVFLGLASKPVVMVSPSLASKLMVGFLVEPKNQGRWVVSGLASKPLGRFFPVWPQNRWRRFSRVRPQNRWWWFLPVWPQNWWWVSWLSLKTKVVEGFQFGPQNGSYSLVIWASKLLLRFLGLVLKTKLTTICRLRHKTDLRMKMVRSTRQDLVACFTWKQVRLGFPVWPKRLVESWRRVVRVTPSRRLCRVHVEDG